MPESSHLSECGKEKEVKPDGKVRQKIQRSKKGKTERDG